MLMWRLTAPPLLRPAPLSTSDQAALVPCRRLSDLVVVFSEKQSYMTVQQEAQAACRRM
jgi:hypothetical protein